MINLLRKITHKINSYKKQYREDLRFSSKLARYRLFSDVLHRLRFRKTAKKFKIKYENWLKKFIADKLKAVVEKYKSDDCLGEFSQEAPVWVCWWTGVDTAPALVKQCINSICKNCGKHTVYMITKDNYFDYIDVPDYMLQKSEAGNMKLAHLADYIRVSLLEKYGGLWLDATIFCSSELPEDYFNIPFFTCRSQTQECGYISQMRWVTFVLGGWKGNVVDRFLKEVFEQYWKTEDSAVDYLMFDYFIELGYDRISGIRKCIENVAFNNLHRDDLQAAMNEALPAGDFDKIIKNDTVLYKLSWREKYSPTTADGNKSIYGFFVDTDI